MQSDQGKERKRDTIVIDPSTIELEAEWGPNCRLWTQAIADIVKRSRHQASILAYLAILLALKLAGISAGDVLIMSISIVSISIVAIFSEWIGSKQHEHSRKREAAPQYAAQNQRFVG